LAFELADERENLVKAIKEGKLVYKNKSKEKFWIAYKME